MYRKFKKATCLLVLVLFSASFISACNEKNASNELVWLVDSKEMANRIQGELNELLTEKDAEYTVNIVAYEDYTDNDYLPNNIDIMTDLKEKNEQIDIAYICNYSDYSTTPYSDAVKNDLLIELDNYIANSDLNEIIDESVWHKLKIDKKIYGVSNKIEKYYFGYCYNQFYLDKYNISTNDISPNIFENKEILTSVAEQEGNGFKPISFWAITEDLFETDFITGSYSVGFNKDGRIVNVLKETTNIDYLKKLKNFKDNNLITFLNIDGFGLIEKENSYFALGNYTYFNDEQDFTITAFSNHEGNTIVTETVFIPESLQYSNDSYENGINGITSWSKNQDYAFDFLTLLYTDNEIANLVSYGIEGRDYKLDNGRVLGINNDGQFLLTFSEYTNPFITFPVNDEPDDKQAYMKNIYNQINKTSFEDFRFDTTNVEKEIQETNKVLYNDGEYTNYTTEYAALCGGEVEDVDKALAELNKKLEAAGIDKIIEETNKQYQEWLANK